MNEMNLENQQALEREFAKNFASPIFPILGELYLKNKDQPCYKKITCI